MGNIPEEKYTYTSNSTLQHRITNYETRCTGDINVALEWVNMMISCGAKRMGYDLEANI